MADNSCGSCGAWIPDGQRFCSMCYGDPYYGRDGYYLAYLEDMERQAYEREQQQQQEPEPQEENS